MKTFGMSQEKKTTILYNLKRNKGDGKKNNIRNSAFAYATDERSNRNPKK